MDNSSVVDNNENSFKEEKPKRKFSKKILIISSLITILIIAVAVFFIISTKYSRMVESYLNAELSKLAADFGDDFNYNQFKCSGFKTITCSSDFIELYSMKQKFLVKNISFSASPSLNTLKAAVNGNIEVSLDSKESDIIKLDFNCLDNMTLLSERAMLANNIVCNSNLNNINSYQHSVIYLKDDLYKRNSSMLGIIKEITDKKVDFIEQYFNSSVIESAYNKIESPALMDDITALIQLIAKSLADTNLTKDDIISFYDALKTDYNTTKEFYGSNEYTAFVDNFINILDSVIYDNSNSVSLSVVLKDKDNIDNIVGEIDKFMLPKYYDIKFESSK